VELYYFFRGTLAWTASVAALWPINVPLAALAYKIQNGPEPIKMPRKELWTRSAFGALAVALLTVVLLWFDYLLAEGADFPAGPIHLIIFMAYIPAAVWLLFVFFACDDLLPGLGLFVIYLYLPVLVLYVLNNFVAFWQPLVSFWEGWLKVPT
jgi:hypothetical protein